MPELPIAITSAAILGARRLQLEQGLIPEALSNPSPPPTLAQPAAADSGLSPVQLFADAYTRNRRRPVMRCPTDGPRPTMHFPGVRPRFASAFLHMMPMPDAPACIAMCVSWMGCASCTFKSTNGLCHLYPVAYRSAVFHVATASKDLFSLLSCLAPCPQSAVERFGVYRNRRPRHSSGFNTVLHVDTAAECADACVVAAGSGRCQSFTFLHLIDHQQFGQCRLYQTRYRGDALSAYAVDNPGKDLYVLRHPQGCVPVPRVSGAWLRFAATSLHNGADNPEDFTAPPHITDASNTTTNTDDGANVDTNSSIAGPEPATGGSASTAQELPSYSYAGYARGERLPSVEGLGVFHVAEFAHEALGGGIPNDLVSDTLAIRMAIAAAELAGGGRVVFDAGTYLVNTEEDAVALSAVCNGCHPVQTAGGEMRQAEPIRISGSNIVLQGAGSRAGGTVIHQVLTFLPEQGAGIYSHVRSAFVFKPDVTSPNNIDANGIFNVTTNAEIGSFWVNTAVHPGGLRVGDLLRLQLQSAAPTTVGRFLAPQTVHSTWRPLEDIASSEHGIGVSEMHVVDAVEGTFVRFREPLQVNIRANEGWKLYQEPHIAEVGVEDMSFMGSWTGNNSGTEGFSHRADAVNSNGWKMISMVNTVDGWIRRASFINSVNPTTIYNSVAISVLQITVAGERGHFPIVVSGSYGVFVGLFEDLSGFYHGPAVKSHACGTVFWRCSWQAAEPFDCHGEEPYTTLVDVAEGGPLYGASTHRKNLPHHLGGLTFWNYKHHGSVSALRSKLWRDGVDAARLTRFGSDT